MFKTFKDQFTIIFILGIVLYLPLMNFFNAWYDEQYSLYLTNLSWKEMFHAIITEDSHPPLHYILLRLWMTGTDFHNVGWARLLNLIIVSLTALLGAFPVRRLAGEKVALWFTGLTFLFPTTLWLATNMRMYALVNLEITALVIYSLLILKEGRKGDWWMFLFLGLILPYTHYFGCLALAFINISLFFAFLCKKENLKENLIKLFSCACFIGITFLPWFIFVFLRQASFMYDKWFVTLAAVKSSLRMLFFPFISRNGNFIDSITILFMSLCWLLLFQYSFDKKNTERRFLAFLPTALFFEVIFAGIVLSLLFRPILVWRYMTPFMGGIIFALSIVLVNEKRFKKIFIILGILCYIGMYAGLYSVVHSTLYQQIQQNIPKAYSAKNTIFLCDDMGAGMLIQFYLPEYTWQRVPSNEELAIPKQLMYRQIIDEENLNTKNILFLTHRLICEEPLEDNYDHFRKLCLIQLSVDDAKKMIANSEKIIYNELH